MPIDYTKYHPKWTLIVWLIRKRAGNRCEGSPGFPDCRAENGRPHPVTGSKVVCTTAHMDHDRTNNRFWNLKFLCQRCHLYHDRKQHAWNRKYGRETKRQNLKLWDQADTPPAEFDGPRITDLRSDEYEF